MHLYKHTKIKYFLHKKIFIKISLLFKQLNLLRNIFHPNSNLVIIKQNKENKSKIKHKLKTQINELPKAYLTWLRRIFHQ